MNTKNNVIKPALLELFNKGKNEIEAHEEISKTHSSHSVSLNTVNKWFEIFRSGDANLGDKKKTGRKPKLPDEFFINLTKENPGLNTKELAKLANTSYSTLKKRLNILISEGKIPNVIKKTSKNFTDEFLINLINENPELNITELAKLTNSSATTISKRLKQINSDEKKVNYCKKGFQNGNKKFTDEFLIKLINENPNLGALELSKLANTSSSTILNRLKQINSNRSSDNKLVLRRKKTKIQKKQNRVILTDEFLINLINDNPELNMSELAELCGTSSGVISKRIKSINTGEEKVKYCKKGFKYGAKKFSDQFLINLVKENPNLNMKELGEITNTAPATIMNRLNQINSKEERANYLKKDCLKGSKKFTDEFLINLINENPEMNVSELALLANTTASTISRRIKSINNDGERIDHNKKGLPKFKLTNEFLINLINENPELNMKELASLSNTTVSAISTRLKLINSDGEKVKYTKKYSQNATTLTDEFLINLVNKNPSLNMAELAKLANTSSAVISKRLKEINSNGERVKYTYKNRKISSTNQ